MKEIKVKYRELSAADITADALLMLKARNCTCWRQNNHATRGRRNNVKKGVTDIIGYHRKTAISLWVEVKKIGDTLSPDQIALMLDAHAAGCICMVAHQIADKTVLTDFLIYYEQYFKVKK